MMRMALFFLLVGILAACTSQPAQPPTTRSTMTAAPELSCVAAVHTGPLPLWARDGFTPPDTPAPQVNGVHGAIVGVVFGYPLHAPRPTQGQTNKILWVANPSATTDDSQATATTSGLLHIHATLNGTNLTADREVPVGPSQVDLPRAGCWTLNLSWGGITDRLAVPYEPT